MRGQFLSTLSLRRATQVKQTCQAKISISIHALLAESDNGSRRRTSQRAEFLSTLSLRRATAVLMENAQVNPIFLSTLSLRRATPSSTRRLTNMIISIHALLAESDSCFCKPQRDSNGISIHALLAESDACYSPALPERYNFYPRSPCGERRINRNVANGKRKFLSTLSLRRATLQGRRSRRPFWDFYPRSPCGERRRHAVYGAVESDFYPRSPCGERRPMMTV